MEIIATNEKSVCQPNISNDWNSSWGKQLKVSSGVTVAVFCQMVLVLFVCDHVCRDEIKKHRFFKGLQTHAHVQ